MKYKVIGIQFGNLESHENHFDEVCDYCEGAFYAGKETYHHVEDGFNFDYKFGIECNICEGRAYYSLILVPLTLCEESREKVIDCCGNEGYEPDVYDIASFGFQVTLGTETEDIEDEDDYEWNSEILDKLASVYKSINSLRGFYLDRPLNLIGTTGWDLLRDAIEGKDAFDAAMSRLGVYK